MNGFWSTSIFTSGSGIRAPIKEVTNNVRTAFHRKSLMVLEQERSSYKNRERASLTELRMQLKA